MALTLVDFQAAAARIGCSVAALRAVVDVEAAGNGFTTHRGQRVPKILFEPHKMWTHSGAFPVSRLAPHLSRRAWIPGLYGQTGGRPVAKAEDRQHVRLEQATALDEQLGAKGALREAALMSCSWGAGQVMGENWRSLGYDSVQAFVNAQYSEAGQLDTMVRYILTNRLADELRRLDWAGFAGGYNGPSYRVNRYHTKLAAAYRKYS